MPDTPHAFTTRDVAYLRHGDRRLMARLFVPHGPGPFPAVVELHGGAWCNGDLTDCQPYAEALAHGGIAVAAVDFRQGGDGCPAALADINYAIRWVKAHAGELNTRPDLIGAAGQSSGGHLAMLAAMRPDDPRSTAIPLPSAAPAVEASLRAVALLWPVINPLSRYRHALRARDSVSPPSWVGDIPQRHDLFWQTEAAMADGNPMLALERGEPRRGGRVLPGQDAGGRIGRPGGTATSGGPASARVTSPPGSASPRMIAVRSRRAPAPRDSRRSARGPA